MNQLLRAEATDGASRMRAVAVSGSHQGGREWPTPSNKKVRCRHHDPGLLIGAASPIANPATDPPTSRPTCTLGTARCPLGDLMCASAIQGAGACRGSGGCIPVACLRHVCTHRHTHTRTYALTDARMHGCRHVHTCMCASARADWPASVRAPSQIEEVCPGEAGRLTSTEHEGEIGECECIDLGATTLC